MSFGFVEVRPQEVGVEQRYNEQEGSFYLMKHNFACTSNFPSTSPAVGFFCLWNFQFSSFDLVNSGFCGFLPLIEWPQGGGLGAASFVKHVARKKISP